MAQPEQPQKLEAPPIIEVVCGLFFPPVPSVDPIFVGGLQRELADEYPRHAIHAPVVDVPLSFMPGPGPLRSWLISKSDEWVLQLQPDRFYVNWRRRKISEYPRFNDSGGVLEKTLFEFTRFRKACKDRLGTDVMPATVELAKVDLIVEGEHWQDVQDLGRVVPLVADVGKFANSPGVELGLNIIDRDPAGITQVVSLSLSTESLLDGSPARALKIETRCAATVASPEVDAVKSGFVELNRKANATFFGLLSPSELGRFKKKN
jgi:uncharacterized protein (TIGR04255 family)